MKEKREKSQPNYLWDVLDAVEKMDAKRSKKEDFSSEHKRAVRAVQVANSFFHKGYISISKARTVLQSRNIAAKEKAKEEQAKLKKSYNQAMIPDKKVKR